MKEFGGIGRTWWVAIGLLVITAVFVMSGHMTVEQWLSYSQMIFAGGVIKSTAVGVSSSLRRLPGEKV